MCDQQTPMEKYRASFSLMNKKARGCKQGCTIRGAHSYVCMGRKLRSDCNSLNGNINTCKTGMAKFGPTADTSSRMARIKQIQNRVIRKTPTNKGTFSGTKRGPHSSVNEKTLIFDQEPFYPQLFGKRKLTNLSGNKGTSGDYLYFKSVIPRMTYNGNVKGCSLDNTPSNAQLLEGKILVVSTKAGATKLNIWNAALWTGAPWSTMAKFWTGGLNDGDVLIWDNDSGTWRPGTPGSGGGADLLNDLEARVAILESKLDPLQGGDAESPTTGDPS